MSILKKTVVLVISLLVILVAGVLLGCGTCLYGLVFLSGWSTAAMYTLWSVLGILAGFVQDTAAQSICHPGLDSPGKKFEHYQSTGWLAIGVSFLTLGALSYLLYRTEWRRGVTSGDGFVPDSMSATITFFISLIVSMCFFQWAFRDADPGRSAAPAVNGRKTSARRHTK